MAGRVDRRGWPWQAWRDAFVLHEAGRPPHLYFAAHRRLGREEEGLGLGSLIGSELEVGLEAPCPLLALGHGAGAT